MFCDAVAAIVRVVRKELILSVAFITVLFG